MDFKKLEEKVIKWGVERDLYHPEHGANATTQLFKFFEEFGELNQAILKNDLNGIKDSIGDCQICLIHRAKFLGEEINLQLQENTEQDVIDFVNYFKEYKNEVLEEAFSEITSSAFNRIEYCIASLEGISILYNFERYECLEHAYNEIKDRKGKMVGGVFVKDKEGN